MINPIFVICLLYTRVMNRLEKYWNASYYLKLIFRWIFGGDNLFRRYRVDKENIRTLVEKNIG